ncbi:MAG: hypothetical protein LBB64_07745 [Dysgonamonadaceae bacterium]|jgi:hypothetical protein|nr:hypothetical protein [Dysgonamonadaceae bacterium]
MRKKGFNSHLKIQFVFVFLFSFQGVYATDGWLTTGAQSFALGNIRAVGNEGLNPAAVSFAEEKWVGLSVFNRFQVDELNTANLYFAYPNKRLDAGFRFSAFGYEEYRISQLQGSFAKKIRPDLSVGIQLNYRNVRSRWEEDSHNGFSSGVGIYYRLNERVDVALLGENLLSLSDNASRNYQAGLQYRASESFVLFLETGSNREIPFRFAAGAEYALFEQFHVRSGYDSDSGMPAFGVGYAWKRWQVDVGFSFHSVLGMSSLIGVRYQL